MHLCVPQEEESVTAYVFYPMPFLEKAIGRIFNSANKSVAFTVSIIYTDTKTPEYSAGTFGYYHVKRVYKEWGPCFNELLSLQYQSGHVVALSWNILGSMCEWMENDPVVYVDDAHTPKLWYSGLEDEIGGVSGFIYYPNFTGPFFGWEQRTIKAPENQTTSAYRVGFSDHHYFMKNYCYGIQGHNRENSTQHLDYTFHWYAAPWPTLYLTDEIDMGLDTSLIQHGYKVKPATSFVNLTSGIDGQWYDYLLHGHDCPEHKQALITRRGTVMKHGGKVSFRVQIHADNEGVILRRLVDLFYTPQRARVYVDGEVVGTWLCSDHAPEYAPMRFADNTDFMIPPRYTYGKRDIRVSVRIRERGEKPRAKRIDYKHLEGFGWTAYHYWVYSIARDGAGLWENTTTNESL